MNDAFVKELRGSFAVPVMFTIAGKERLVTPSGWVDATPRQNQVATLELVTLTGLRDYLSHNVDTLAPGKLMLHVANHAVVELIAAMEDEEAKFRRHVHVRAAAPAVAFPFGRYLDSEEFTIGLQTAFEPTTQRAELVTLVASIKESAVRETVDDGVAQEVTSARGVTLVGRTKVPNPVTLRPYRTFREIMQPESDFVLRLKSGNEGEKPTCALFEADGGQWKLAAILGIATWLRTNITNVATIA